MSELLSISIPQRNRYEYIKKLILSIENQYYDGMDIKVYVFDDDSNDGSSQWLQNKFSFPYEYQLNSPKLGGDQNILNAYVQPKGKYIWVIGNDDYIPDGGLETVLILLKRYNPGILLTDDGNYKKFLPDIAKEYYSNYKEFAEECNKYNPHLLVAHSLISANVIRKDCFDSNFALENQKYCYGHLMGMINGLSDNDSVVLTITRTLGVDQQPHIDGEWPDDLEGLQVKYLKWIKDKYNLTYNENTVLSDYRKRQ